MVLHITEYEIQGSISDNHTYLTDTIGQHTDTLVDAEIVVAIPPVGVKLLSEVLSKQEDDELIGVLFNGNLSELTLASQDGLLCSTPVFSPGKDSYQLQRQIMNPELWNTVVVTGTFEVSADRWSKLARIKPTTDPYPVSLKIIDHKTFGGMAVFKKGPTVAGALTFLDADYLRKDVASEAWLW